MAYVHLGIDYGTSASKVIFRDYDAPGGEKSYPLFFNGSFRIPSDLAIVGNRLHFGYAKNRPGSPSGALWYQSVKMRVAAEHGATLHGTPFAAQSPPNGWTFEDLAILSVAWLNNKAREAAAEAITRTKKLKFGMTLGVPSDFRYSATTTNEFLKIARAAQELDRVRAITGDSVVLDAVLRRHLETALADARATRHDGGSIDEWVRSEARASILWAWEAPELEPEPYIKVDIGAGTTNVAAFLIAATPKRSKNGAVGWEKSGIAVFGAASGTVGMNTLLATPNATSSSIPAWLSTYNGGPTLRVTFEDPYRKVFDAVRQKTCANVASTRQWHRTRPIMLGGGSMNPHASRALQFNPFVPNTFFTPIVFHRPPVDLQQIKSTDADRSNARISLTVAYGLSVLDDILPSERQPAEIIPVEKLPPRRRPAMLGGDYDK